MDNKPRCVREGFWPSKDGLGTWTMTEWTTDGRGTGDECRMEYRRKKGGHKEGTSAGPRNGANSPPRRQTATERRAKKRRVGRQPGDAERPVPDG